MIRRKALNVWQSWQDECSPRLGQRGSGASLRTRSAGASTIYPIAIQIAGNIRYDRHAALQAFGYMLVTVHVVQKIRAKLDISRVRSPHGYTNSFAIRNLGLHTA